MSRFTAGHLCRCFHESCFLVTVLWAGPAGEWRLSGRAGSQGAAAEGGAGSLQRPHEQCEQSEHSHNMTITFIVAPIKAFSFAAFPKENVQICFSLSLVVSDKILNIEINSVNDGLAFQVLSLVNVFVPLWSFDCLRICKHKRECILCGRSTKRWNTWKNCFKNLYKYQLIWNPYAVTRFSAILSSHNWRKWS